MAELITAYVGLNGSGKTLCMMETAILPWLRNGGVVLANMPIFASIDDAHLPSEERELHPSVVPLKSWRQIDPGMTRTLVVLDEISSMFDARESGKMPTQLITRFQQLRKNDNAVAWTGPDWDRADKVLRSVTRAVWYSVGYLPEAVEGREWRSNRLFRFRRYSTATFDRFVTAQAESDRADTPRHASQRFYLRKRHEAQLLYDTYASVSLLDHLDEFGTCIECGGTRRRVECSCADYQAKKPQRSRQRSGGR